MQVLFLLCLLCAYLYIAWPALYGSFILDDWPNLGSLEKVNNWQDIWAYTFSGASSSLGRPLSYFTYALQAEHWFSNPYPFKLANVLIHFVNAVLFYGCSYLVAGFIGVEDRKRAIFAGLCCTWWLFLPLSASTIFYVVQRMTLLAGTFTLIGLLGFLYAVSIGCERHFKRERWIATVSVLLGYFLGVLSKENAIMLGVFVCVLYLSLIRSGLGAQKKWWDKWVALFAVAPLMLLFTYLVLDSRYLSGYGVRDFSPIERVMTEWRILWDYLLKILYPSPSRINLFNDDVLVSRGLFNPFNTLSAGLAWLVLIIIAWRKRAIAPYILFGLAWFLGGHLLESTIVGLELYFEHRNYIPSIGIILAAVWFIFILWDRAEGMNTGNVKIVAKASIGVVVLVCSGWYMMVFSAEVDAWKDQKSFTMSALLDRPNSLRANQEAASYLASSGDYRGSTLLLYEIDSRWPDYPGTYAWLMFLKCVDRNVVLPSREDLTIRFSEGKFDLGTGTAFNEMYRIKQNGACENLSWDDYRYWLSLVIKNPNFPGFGRKKNLLRLTVFSYMAEARWADALEALNVLSERGAGIDMLKLKVELLSLVGRDDDALLLINRVKLQYQRDIKTWNAKGQYFLNFEKKIREKLEAGNNTLR